MKLYRLTIDVLLSEDTGPNYVESIINKELRDYETIVQFECEQLEYNGE
jgi:hypothetical protein